jgi:hypothetical protein
MKILFVIFASVMWYEEVEQQEVSKGAPAVVGTAAEDMILEGTVLDYYSTEVQYGVKHYYLVLFKGYKWLCEQATYRIACSLETLP